MKAVIDRIENGTAVLEVPGTGHQTCSAGLLPEGAAEGDVLDIDIRIDREARRKREEEARELQEKLKKN